MPAAPPCRLAWRTPTGAVLWEIWARQKRLFIAQALGLLLSALFVHLPRVFGGDREALLLLAYYAALLAFAQTLTSFCYVEVDARRLQGGIPGHLLLKPLSTTRLVAVPMFYGGAIVVALFLAWVGLVLRQVGFPTAHLFWSCTVLLSFTWWVQAVVWSSANLAWGVQLLLVMLTATVHLCVALVSLLAPQMPSGWRTALVAGLLVGSFPLARAGVARIRQGAWEGGRGAGRRVLAPSPGRASPFRSAFGAQFWLEWRRQGLKLPLFTVVGLLFFILMDTAVRLAARGPGGDALQEDATRIFLTFVILTPILCSVMLGDMIAQFDVSLPGAEMPVFVAIRPMSNGGFVLAKLAMAAVSSLLTWLAVAVALVVWLVPGGRAARVWHALPPTPLATAELLLPLFLVLVLLTWRNLLAGICLGLTARPRMIGLVNCLRFPAYVALGALISRATGQAELRATLLNALPWILGACLAAKLLGSAATFHFGLRRKAVTRGAIGWIFGGWLACGLFVAVLTRSVCLRIGAPQWWVWGALAGFCLLPLAQLSLAPLALAWNRHR